jgi:hypothetical protein
MFQVFMCFIRMLQMFYLDVAYVLQWLQTCFPGVSDVCYKYFNCFRYMLQVFHLDVAKVDLSVVHVAVRPISSSHILQLLGPPACMWVWRRRHDAGVGNEARVGHGAGVEHEATQVMVRGGGYGAARAPHEAGAGIRTLSLSGRPGARRPIQNEIFLVQHAGIFSTKILIE